MGPLLWTCSSNSLPAVSVWTPGVGTLVDTHPGTSIEKDFCPFWVSIFGFLGLPPFFQHSVWSDIGIQQRIIVGCISFLCCVFLFDSVQFLLVAESVSNLIYFSGFHIFVIHFQES